MKKMIIVIPVLVATFCAMCSVLEARAPEATRKRYAAASKAPSHSEIYHEQSGYGKYRFGYKVHDAYKNNHQSRHEERDESGTVRGHYSLVEPDGNVRVVYYVADKYGFRAYVKNSHKPHSVHGDLDRAYEKHGRQNVYQRYGRRAAP